MSTLLASALSVALSVTEEAFTPAVAVAGLIDGAKRANAIGRKIIQAGRDFAGSVCAVMNLTELDKADRTKAHKLLCDACADLNQDFTVQSSTKGSAGAKVTTWSVVDRIVKTPEQKKSESDAAAAAAATAAASKLEAAVTVATTAAVAPVQTALELALAERDMLSKALAQALTERDAALSQITDLLNERIKLQAAIANKRTSAPKGAKLKAA
jgi:hypothetical protein